METAHCSECKAIVNLDQLVKGAINNDFLCRECFIENFKAGIKENKLGSMPSFVMRIRGNEVIEQVAIKMFEKLRHEQIQKRLLNKNKKIWDSPEKGIDGQKGN